MPTYINYPISQSLLRRTDKDKLRQLFQEKQWQAEWDAQTLFAHVRREAGGFGIHLKDLLTEKKQRHEAIVEALHQVYEQWKAQGCPTVDKNNYCTWIRHLFCGLYRTEDPLLGQVDYYLYPKQQRGRKLESVEVQLGHHPHLLREERPGWYFPLEYSISEKELDNGAKYQITSPDDLDYLILPGGLRVPKIGAWLVNHSPQITIFGFYSTAELKITRLLENQTIIESSQSTNTSIKLDLAHPGDYLIEANFAGESSQRLVKIVDWNDLDIEKYVHRQVMPINSVHHIFGSVIQQNF